MGTAVISVEHVEVNVFPRITSDQRLNDVRDR